jgi:hypothetical protein
MSPASYLTAPPRVASPSIASIAAMSSLTWGAFGFFLFVLLAGAVGLGASAVAFWRRLRAVRASGGAALEELNAGLHALEGRMASFERDSSELGRALSRLDRSLKRVRVLLRAWRDASDTVSGWLLFLPRK